jgi:hypothetical protein
MKPQVVVRHHHETRGKTQLLRSQYGQACHERLATTVPATKELDGSLAGFGQLQLSHDLIGLFFRTNGKRFHSALRHQAFA